MACGVESILAVVASEAKQSRAAEEELDCFVARAPRNDATNALTRGGVTLRAEILEKRS
jgi:hypothetical protein